MNTVALETLGRLGNEANGGQNFTEVVQGHFTNLSTRTQAGLKRLFDSCVSVAGAGPEGLRGIQQAAAQAHTNAQINNSRFERGVNDRSQENSRDQDKGRDRA